MRKVLWLCAPISAYEQNIKVKGQYKAYNEEDFFKQLDILAEGKIEGNIRPTNDAEGDRQLIEFSKRRALVINMRPLLEKLPGDEDILVMSVTPTTGHNPTVPNELFKRADGALIVYESGTSKFQGKDERPFFKWLRRFTCVHKSVTV